MRPFSLTRRTRPVLTPLMMLGLVVAACGNGGADRLSSAGATVATGTPDGHAAEPPVSGEVVVFAAASLREAFTDLGGAFTAAYPDTSVTLNFAASSELAAQIAEGAPADVYASADLDNMAKLTGSAAGDGEPVVFATNTAEIVVAPGNPMRITGVEDLADDDLVLLVCAPEVPCGAYAARILEHAAVTVDPDSFEENVKAVVTKVALGEADAGIAFATDVRAAGDDADGVEIPAGANVVAEYPIVVTVEAPNPAGARAFVDFVTSDDGRTIMSAHGFGSP